MSSAFRYIIRAREKLYQSGVLRTKKLNHPVVSVGNLTFGGNGKTPLVLTLATALRAKGFQPVILSRGYKRTGRGILIVENDWEQAGDEPFMMARRLKDIPVVVGADRYEAGRFAEARGLGNLFILDDGFQHRQLHRDFDIVMVDPAEWSAGERLLPAGKWREPKTAIARAHAACILEKPNVDLPSLPLPAFVVRTRIEGLFDAGHPVPAESLRGKAVVAFAGIAKPERFFASLRSLGIEPTEEVRFRDHHRFSKQDVEGLKGDVLVTTEKDAVRLEGLSPRGFLTLRVSATIPEFDRLLEMIQERLNFAKS